MLKRLLIISFLIFPLLLRAQSEEKFGLIKVTEENKAFFEQERAKVPYFRSGIYRLADDGVELPSHVDNAKNKYFPKVVAQISNSCGPASVVHYIYTYEMNRLLDRDGKDLKNVASYLYIYNFLNNGKPDGTYPQMLFSALDTYGAASEADFVLGSKIDKYAITEWMHGYDKYVSAAEYGVEDNGVIKFVSDEEGQIDAMKRYLYDRGNGTEGGGLIQFSGWAHPLDADVYDGESETGYTAMIHHFGHTGMHSMTIVGYDDVVWYDYNGNGEKEDDEVGAFICVNTWGERWGDRGFFYAPYRTFTIMPQSTENVDDGGGTGNHGKVCYAVYPRTKEVKAMMKFTVQHTSRSNLSYVLQGLDETGAAVFTQQLPQMKKAGGDHPIRAGHTQPKDLLEFGFDISEYYVDGVTDYIMTVRNQASYGSKEGSGQLLSCSIVDYTDPTNPKEMPAMITQHLLQSDMDAVAKISTKMDMEPGQDVVIFHTQNSRALFLNFQVKNECKACVYLYDANGKQIKTFLEDTLPVGVTVKQFNIEETIVDGNYFLKTVVNNNVELKKIIIKSK